MSYVTELIENELQRYYYDNVFVEGDLSIAISYFDDFYFFELMEESDGEDVPLDLSNIDDVQIVFFDDIDTVRISRMKNAADIDPSQGEVMFKISEEDSATILTMENNNFYITLISGTGAERDEISIVKSKFYDLETFNERILTVQQQNVSQAIAARIRSLQNSQTRLQSDVTEVESSNKDLNEQYNQLVNSYVELEKKYKEALGRLQSLPGTTNSPFVPQNADNAAPNTVAVADLPVSQVPDNQDGKSTKEKEQDLESNNQLVILPTGGASPTNTGGTPSQNNPFNNIGTL